MIKKLSKHGNSVVLLIDKPILELLQMDENSYVSIKTDGTNIIIEPIKSQDKVPVVSKDPLTQKKYQELMDKYDALFKKLAKN